MSHYKAYAAYKVSDVESLGQVPEHWKVTPFKWLADIRNGKDYKDVETEDSGFPVIGSGGEFARASQYLFNGESVLLGRKGTVDRPLYINGPFWTVDTMFYTVIGPKAVGKYLYYCSLNIQFDRYLTSTALPSMTQEVLGKIQFAVPEIHEQCAIIAHLDRETARIDALVSKKTRFIELLREKRQALITNAVTKGLDPTVSMKDSGVEWLGQVPNEWDVTPLKYIGSAIIGLTYSPEDVVEEDEGTLVLRSSNIQDGRITLDDKVFVKANIPHHLITRLGDILICSRNGSRSLIGKNGMIDSASEGLSFGAFTTVFRTKHYKFLYYVLNSSLFKFQAGRFLTTTINQLTTETLNSFEIPLPPSDEQDLITEYLDRETLRLDTIISKTERSIELLKERRCALITAAVTGQIDLREAA